jgi:class 3 adenylate cyclase/pimeloyl-ACP methyl ester carboxylesterase
VDYHVRYFQSEDGSTIAAARGGRGSPVVVAPAFGTSLEMSWAAYSAAFSEHQVITWDRRGFGLSERDAPCTDPAPYLADAQAVVDGFGLESFDVVGTLMGTIEATVVAAWNSSRVSRLVLRAPVTGLADWASIPGVVAARAALEHDWEFFTEAFAQFVVGWGNPGGPELAATLRTATTREELGALFEAFIKLDLLSEYTAIGAATLVEHHPGYFFPDSYARRIASLIDNCELVVYSGAANEFMNDFSRARSFIAARDESVTADGPGAHTIMFTDLVASTALTQRLGDSAAQEIVHQHDAAVRAALAEHGGRQIKHTGDGIMATFSSAANALRAAAQIQRSTADSGIGIRIGLNTGEPIVEAGDLFGTAVQLAARITDRARPGQTLVSNVVRELCAGKQFTFDPVGEHQLKGFDAPVALFEARAPTTTAS